MTALPLPYAPTFAPPVSYATLLSPIDCTACSICSLLSNIALSSMAMNLAGCLCKQGQEAALGRPTHSELQLHVAALVDLGYPPPGRPLDVSAAALRCLALIAASSQRTACVTGMLKTYGEVRAAWLPRLITPLLPSCPPCPSSSQTCPFTRLRSLTIALTLCPSLHLSSMNPSPHLLLLPQSSTSTLREVCPPYLPDFASVRPSGSKGQFWFADDPHQLP